MRGTLEGSILGKCGAMLRLWTSNHRQACPFFEVSARSSRIKSESSKRRAGGSRHFQPHGPSICRKRR